MGPSAVAGAVGSCHHALVSLPIDLVLREECTLVLQCSNRTQYFRQLQFPMLLVNSLPTGISCLSAGRSICTDTKVVQPWGSVASQLLAREISQGWIGNPQMSAATGHT